ncbi:UNVERIFIED_CONTAM: pit [Trichonephila clavipes]
MESVVESLGDNSFSSLKGKVSDKTLKAIAEMGFEKMTEIQAKSLPHLLEGRDTVVSAKTGSGKTLAFLILAVERMHRLKFKPRNGTGVMVISPTRELSMQTYGILKQLAKYHSQTHGLIIGGGNRESEVKKLENGVNILVATPGRLLDHLQNTTWFLFKNVHCLIIDEADRILNIGFEADMRSILTFLPKFRQSLLFSATINKKTEDLISLALRKPLYIGVENNEIATVENLKQGYILCPAEKKFLFLFSFLKKYHKKKVMGQLKQQKRTSMYFQFCKAKSGILLCTDVAARGLDIPKVDWILQYDPPDDPKEYIHRVGRTARGENTTGNAWLMLRPEEIHFRNYLKNSRIPLQEYSIRWNIILEVQEHLEEVVMGNYHLKHAAREAFIACIRAYKSHHLKKVFDISKLDFTALSKTFGLTYVPHVDS